MKKIKQKFRFILCVLGTLFLLYTGRNYLYWAYFGFDDEKAYQGEIWEYRVRTHLFNQDADAHYQLAGLLSKHMSDGSDRVKRRVECIVEYMTCLELDNRNADAYFSLAVIYEINYGPSETTNALYEKCVELNPSSMTYQAALASSYEKQGKKEEANRHYAISEQLAHGWDPK